MSTAIFYMCIYTGIRNDDFLNSEYDWNVDWEKKISNKIAVAFLNLNIISLF